MWAVVGVTSGSYLKAWRPSDAPPDDTVSETSGELGGAPEVSRPAGIVTLSIGRPKSVDSRIDLAWSTRMSGVDAR